LIDLLLEDEKNQTVMKEVLKKIYTHFDSHKKLLSTEKTFKAINVPKEQERIPLAMSTNFNYSKRPEKEKSIK
jgi:hypothetical protein